MSYGLLPYIQRLCKAQRLLNPKPSVSVLSAARLKPEGPGASVARKLHPTPEFKSGFTV